MKVTIKYKGNGLKPLPFSIIIIPQNCSENKATNVWRRKFTVGRRLQN